MLARFQADPEQLHSIVSQARAKSHALDGRGLANLLSTCVLSEQFDESLYAWAMTSDMLRSRKYDDADVALLYHVHVALQHAAPVWYAHSKRIPVDIVAAAHRRLTSATERLQGMYDVLRLAFHRAGLPYSYRTVDKETGYLLWLQTPCAGVPSHAAAPQGATTLIARASVEIAGEWNSIPGTDTPSLAHRLYCRNLMLVSNVGTATISAAERAKFMGENALHNLDIVRDHSTSAEATSTQLPITAGAAALWARPGAGAAAASRSAPLRSRQNADTLDELVQAIAWELAHGYLSPW